MAATFRGELRWDQKPAVEALLAHDCGVLAAATAFGKTVVAANLIAHRGRNTLVIVHRQQLMQQWIERLAEFLDLPAESIGRIGGGKNHSTGRLDVALIQSLVRRRVVKDLVADYGHVVIDECHRLPAVSFELVARRCRARHVLGLSATLTRKDGHHPIITMQCGPVRFRVDAKQKARERPFAHRVVVRPTALAMPIDAVDESGKIRMHRLYEAIAADDARDGLIVADALAAVAEGRSPLVLTERREHLARLAERLAGAVPHLVVLRGGLGKAALRDRLEALRRVPEAEGRVVLATGRFIGEGFDDNRLDTLLLAMPISWRGTVAQYAGRLHRLHERKREVRIHDYADLEVPVLARMFDRRCAAYESIGYRVELPASAVPGWPQDVPLPVDPQWKRDYSGSVRRLVRDGVDQELGGLFVQVARTPTPGAQGIEAARSSSEAFLYRRLQTLPETANRFQLNASLPIPFLGSGGMEVDFLFAEERVVVELDGDQHLGDPEAYRRDRLKDARLQEAGYRVLRFLARDLGPRLGPVLDGILSGLAPRDRSAGGTGGTDGIAELQADHRTECDGYHAQPG